MSFYYLTNNLLIASLVLAVASGIYQYRQLDKAMKWLWLECCLTLMSDGIAYYAAVRYRNNLGVFSFSSIADAFLICMYFNYSNHFFRRHHIGIIAAGLSVIVGLVSNFVIQSPASFPSYFLHYQALAVIVLSLLSLAYMQRTHDYLDIRSKPHFWVCIVLIFYWCTTYFNWTLLEYYAHLPSQESRVVLLSMFFTNLITNLATALLFFLTPKMRAYGK